MLISVNIIKKDEISNNKYKGIKKSGNKMIEILVKLKNRNLFKFRFINLFKFKQVQSTSIIKESNFLSSNIRIVFSKLR